jgi:hypothetical protein
MTSEYERRNERFRSMVRQQIEQARDRDSLNVPQKEIARVLQEEATREMTECLADDPRNAQYLKCVAEKAHREVRNALDGV